MTAFHSFDLRRELSTASSDDAHQPPHARAFAGWIQHSDIGAADILRRLASEAAATDGPARQTAHAAVLGYAVDLDPSFKPAFGEAVEWLRKRQYFVPGRPLAFEIDGLALVGVSLGIRRLDGPARDGAQKWLNALLEKSLTSRRPTDWNESLIATALALISTSQHAAMSSISDDLQVALAEKGVLSRPNLPLAGAWKLISDMTAGMDGMTRAAAQLTALSHIARNSATVRFDAAASLEDVAQLLRGIARSMRRWPWEAVSRTPKSRPARWDIENEYHVQDLLWAILAPVFPDLDDEEWLKSLGHHHPRADLAIPSLAIIIEVKFLREGGKAIFSSVIQEVATDASTYLQDSSPYKHIVAFVWDDLARTEEHEELRQGLKRIRGVHEAIVLSRPSKMVRAI